MLRVPSKKAASTPKIHFAYPTNALHASPKYSAGTLQNAVGDAETPTGYQNERKNCKNSVVLQKINIFQPHLDGFRGTFLDGEKREK